MTLSIVRNKLPKKDLSRGTAPSEIGGGPAMAFKRQLCEHFLSVGPEARVQRDAGLIRDVLILAPKSANGRTYTADALASAVKLYEGISVYVDHSEARGRSLRDKIGWLENVRFANGQLRGDLRICPEHPDAKTVFWYAENRPQSLGLSHDAEGVVRSQNGEVLVEQITAVFSVDLVAEPATVKSLFEGKAMLKTRVREQEPEPTTDTSAPSGDPLELLYQQLTLDDLKAKRPDLLDALRKEIQNEIASSTSELKAKLDELSAQLEQYMTAEEADTQMAEAKIDPHQIPPRLREMIRREKDRGKRAQLIEEVKKLTAPSPTSTSGWRQVKNESFIEKVARWRI